MRKEIQSVFTMIEIDDFMIEKMISVIIPTYNEISHIEKALDSIAKQTYRNVEVIVVDDCSVDGTYDFVMRLRKEAKYQYTLKVFRMEKNSGHGNARNRGLRDIDGEYVMFLDADDTLEPNALERMIVEIDDDVDMCICSFYRIRNGKKQIGLFNKNEGCFSSRELVANIFRTWPLNWFSCVGTKLYKTKLIKQCNIQFNESDYKYNEDLGFVVDYIRICKMIKVIKDELYCYTYTPGSVQHKGKYQEGSVVTITNSRMNFRRLLIENMLLEEMEEVFAKSQIEMYFTMMITNWNSYNQFEMVFEQICNYLEMYKMFIVSFDNMSINIFLHLCKKRKTKGAYLYFKLLDVGKRIVVSVRNGNKV